MTTTCHPATAWALMTKGLTVYQIATRYRDLPRDLDEAIWAWRTARTGTDAPAGLTTMQALNRRNDSLATASHQRSA